MNPLPNPPESIPICVLGEALMDCVTLADGSLRPLMGGSPYNLSRAAARQGAQVSWLGPLSVDAFGEQLLAQARADGVQLLCPRSARPTALAVVSLKDGVPQYGFYREGVADRDWDAQALLRLLAALPAGVLHTGSLMLVPPDHDKTLAVIQGARDLGWCISVDVNLRARLADDAVAYRRAVWAVAAQADWLKASDEDLAELGLGDARMDSADALRAAFLRRLAEAGSAAPGPSRLALTFGPQGAALWVNGAKAAAPAPDVNLLDTVGAGDTFWGACLADWVRDPDANPGVRDTLSHALAAAAINCERAGCQPPTHSEVRARLSTRAD